MNAKACPGCGETKALSAFYKNARAKDGRQVRCKACQKEYQDANRERARQRSEEWRRKRGIAPKKPKPGRRGGAGTLFPGLGD